MRRFLALILAAAACLSLAACGGGTPGKQPSTADVVKAVGEQLVFKDSMMIVDDSQVPLFYQYDEDKVAEKTMYASGSRATAEEVTVFKAKDAADAAMLKTAMEGRIAEQKLAYESYMPAELPKIEGAVIYTSGSYAILVMADDTAKVEETFQAQFK